MKSRTNIRKCPCGKMFSPTDPNRELCIECHLAAKDAQWVKEGPSKVDHTVKGIQRPLNARARLLRPLYDDRLAEGFAMMEGENE